MERGLQATGRQGTVFQFGGGFAPGEGRGYDGSSGDRSNVCGSSSDDEQGCFLDQPAEGTQVDEQVGEGDISCGARQSIRPDSLEAEAGGLAIAPFGGILTAIVVLVPEGRIVGMESSQALMAGAVRMDEGAADVLHLA